jgi:hypothetical protein
MLKDHQLNGTAAFVKILLELAIISFFEIKGIINVYITHDFLQLLFLFS